MTQPFLLADVILALDEWRVKCALTDSTQPRCLHLQSIWSSRFFAILGDVRAAFEARLATMGEPDLRISRKGRPYLERWHIERAERRSVYLHRFLGDDPDVGPHDHPWDSASLLVAGTLDESWLRAGSDRNPPFHRVLRPGEIAYRPARFAHQLRIRHASEPPLTVFVTGPLVRQWGFWVERGYVRTLERHPIELQEETT